MTTAHNSSTRRYLIPSGSVHILKSKKELYSGGKNSHEYLMTSTERKTVSSHFESDICRENWPKLSTRGSQSVKDIQRRTKIKCNIFFFFNESLIKVNSSTEGAALCRRQFQALGT